MTPLMFDYFCCAGGAGRGYHDAGFRVVGIDKDPQPNYPYEFVQADALEHIAENAHVTAVRHASPPCQLYTPLNAYNHKEYPDLIAPARDALIATGQPYIIENVEAARPELIDPIMLCGPMFGLKMYRHRLFETSFPIERPLHWDHEQLCTRNGYLPTPARPFMTITGGKHSRAWQQAAAEAMGTPWMRTVREVCESIPPAYTEFIGTQLLALVEVAA